MISKMEKFEALLCDKKEYSKNYLYSQIIKNERTRRKLTLSEMSKGICSISYLCKFEKNSIIADDEYIKAIFERINLDYTRVGQNIIEDGVKNTIKAYLYNKHQSINEKFELIDDSIFNAQNYLIKGFYYLINERYVKFKDTIATLDNIKDTLIKEDIGVFMFLVIEYYIKTNQFVDADNYLKYLDTLCFQLDDLNWLIYEQHFIVGYNLKKYPVVYKYYNKLMANYNIGYPSKRQLIIRMMMLDFEANVYSTNATGEIKLLNLDSIENDYFYEAMYWKFVIMIKGGLYFDVYDEIMENNYLDHSRFISLLLYCADLINDENYMNRALEIANSYVFNENETIYQKFIRFIMIKHGSDKKYSIIEYLKYNVIPYNNTFMHHIFSEVYEKYYIEYLCKTSKYKEALSFYKK